MRIVYVTRNYDPVIGGAERHVQALAECHAARGHTVTVFTQPREERAATLPDEEDIRGVRVIRFAPEEGVRRRLDRFLRLRGGWRLGRAVLSPGQLDALSGGTVLTAHVRRVLRDRPDVITTANWALPQFLMPLYLARRLLRTPIVGMPLLHTEMPWTDSPATADMLAGTDALLANTPHEVRFCAARGFPLDRMHDCGTGTDPSAFSRPDGARLRERHGLGDAPVVGYVGRMQVDKGVLLLVEAMRSVWRTWPRTRLLLAGRHLPPEFRDHGAFRAALDGLDPAERARVVHIDGFPAEDKASIFAACDVYAMSSITDSFGQTYLEAWLAGRPVIGARVPAIECVIEHGVDGLLVPPRSAPALADALVALLADPRRRDAMGAAGRAKTLARFTWDRVTDRVEASYRETLHQGRRSMARAG